MTITSTVDRRRRCSVMTATVSLLVLLVTIAAHLPAGARASAIRGERAGGTEGRHRRDVPADLVPAASPTDVQGPAAAAAVVREKRTLLKLKPLVVLPAKLALDAGAKVVTGAKLGVKAVKVGSKALGVGLVGLKAVKKVAKVTVKAATALGVKAVLLNFLFQKINQAIDFKTRLLGNLEQRNRQQNAQFLSPIPKSSSIGNKDETAFVPEMPQGFVGSADTPGFVTVAPPQSPQSSQSFSPASDLIASPPSPQNEQSLPPQGFVVPPPPPPQHTDDGTLLSDTSF